MSARDVTTQLQDGDFFSFDKGIVEARRISKPKVIAGTGRHKQMRATCKHNAVFYLEKAWHVR